MLFAVVVFALVAGAQSQLSDACVNALSAAGATLCQGVPFMPTLEFVCGLDDGPCRTAVIPALIACLATPTPCDGVAPPTGDPATGDPTAETPDPIGACFINTRNAAILAGAAAACQTENYNIQTDLAVENSFCRLQMGGACRTALNSVFMDCVGIGINLICNPPEFPTPSPDQAACVTAAESANSAALDRDCPTDGIDDLMQSCQGTTCRNLINRIFTVPCNGYDPLTTFCAALGITQAPTQPPTNAPSTTPNLESECISNAVNQPILTAAATACRAENYNVPDDFLVAGSFCRLQMGGECRRAIDTVVRNCLGIGISVVCNPPEFPTPNSPSQAMCVGNAESMNSADLERDCSFDDIEQIRAVCEGTTCRNLVNRIFVQPCGYDPITTLCNSIGLTQSPPTDGSIKVYAVPAVVLFSILIALVCSR